MAKSEKRWMIYLLFGAVTGVLVFYAIVVSPGDHRYMLHLKTYGPLDIRQQQLKRLHHLQRACTDNVVYKDVLYKRQYSKYYYSSKYNFSYCRVLKVGSTFWTQAFIILQNNASTAEAVFSMNRMKLHFKRSKAISVAFESEARRNSRTVLISRDPYSRLFSAFIDKMFLPEAYPTAVGIIQRQRKTNSSCANDITFEEFLKDIIESVRIRKRLNMHWVPIDYLCHPCDVDAFAIIKLETFTADVEYVLKEVGVADREFEVINDALHDHRLETSIPGFVKEVTHVHVEQCMNRLEVARRIWKAFQIQGHIHDDILFPTNTIDTSEKARNPEFLTKVILETIKKHPMSHNEAKLQRRRALVKAFGGVGKDVLDEIKELYKQDFILFDYSTKPPTMEQ